MMDKNREAFEAWWKQPEQAELRASCSMGWGYYIWHNSRRAIEVELNGDACHSDDYFNDGYRIATEAAEEAITSLGIRVKGNEE